MHASEKYSVVVGETYIKINLWFPIIGYFFHVQENSSVVDSTLQIEPMFPHPIYIRE